MNAYFSLIAINLKLAVRERVVIFFNFVFPLIFFFAFGQLLDAQMGREGLRVVAMVLVLGVLGNGLFGAGIRAVVERENNILRRYKVAPITPLPILLASIVTGWLLYLPVIVLVIFLAHFLWGTPLPARWFDLLLLLSVGACAMRGIGLIVAAVVNSTQEGNIVTQLLYMPMLFLSGATFPMDALPGWAQVTAQFLPATYLHSGMERILIRGESLADDPKPLLGLLACAVVATWIANNIFRWEKEEKIGRAAKLWLLVVGLPFIALGVHEIYTRDNIDAARSMNRELRRHRIRLIREARIFLGDGRVIESGGLLLREGKIAAIYDGSTPDPDALKAEVVEAAGKTLLPGLIDFRVHLSEPGGVLPPTLDAGSEAAVSWELSAYLYSGVTAVREAGQFTDPIRKARDRISTALDLGPTVWTAGPDSGNGVYIPALAAVEARQMAAAGDTGPLDRSLVAQVAPAGMIAATRAAYQGRTGDGGSDSADLALAMQRLLQAYQSGRKLVAGTDSGIPLLLHGPAIHRELQLWVAAGIPPADALRAATVNAAEAAGMADQAGRIQLDYPATLLVVDGNPLEDISATERISVMFFEGERVNRNGLFGDKR